MALRGLGERAGKNKKLVSHKVKKVKTNFPTETIFEFPCNFVILY